MNEETHFQEARQYWNEAAADFDNEPDHGLHSQVVLQEWIKLLRDWFPTLGSILDIGCGTGSISVVLAHQGHNVSGCDLAPNMIELARKKAQANNLQIDFQVMNAAYPEFNEHQFDGIICRHLLWALPEPDQVLTRWIKFLKPGARLVLVEGYWGSVGLHAEDILKILPNSLSYISVQDLSQYNNLWGKKVTDERYVIIGEVKG